MSDKALTIAEAAAVLEETPETVLELIESNAFPGAYQTDPEDSDSEWLIPPEDIDWTDVVAEPDPLAMVNVQQAVALALANAKSEQLAREIDALTQKVVRATSDLEQARALHNRTEVDKSRAEAKVEQLSERLAETKNTLSKTESKVIDLTTKSDALEADKHALEIDLTLTSAQLTQAEANARWRYRRRLNKTK